LKPVEPPGDLLQHGLDISFRRLTKLVAKLLPGHGVQRLDQIGSPLEDYLFLELLGIAGMPGNELLQALETVVDCGFVESCLKR